MLLWDEEFENLSFCNISVKLTVSYSISCTCESVCKFCKSAFNSKNFSASIDGSKCKMQLGRCVMQPRFIMAYHPLPPYFYFTASMSSLFGRVARLQFQGDACWVGWLPTDRCFRHVRSYILLCEPHFYVILVTIYIIAGIF